MKCFRLWIAIDRNPHLKVQTLAIASQSLEEQIALADAPAGSAVIERPVHHAWIGGLIEHVLSLCHLAKYTAAHYKTSISICCWRV